MLSIEQIKMYQNKIQQAENQIELNKKEWQKSFTELQKLQGGKSEKTFLDDLKQKYQKIEQELNQTAEKLKQMLDELEKNFDA